MNWILWSLVGCFGATEATAPDSPHASTVTAALSTDALCESLTAQTDAIAYARFADQSSGATRDLLLGVHGLMSPTGPVWLVEQQGTPCAVLLKAKAPLQAVATHWKAAPPCLKKHLHDPLLAAMNDLGNADCFCEHRATVESDVNGLATALLALRPLAGPAVYANLKSRRRLDQVHFSGACPLNKAAD